MSGKASVKIYFSDYFGLEAKTVHDYGAFNVSLINDLPLFIDPFLLFTSKTPVYTALHDEIIRYLHFLRDKAATGAFNDGQLKAWFVFSEVKQTWLGFSKVGNSGLGLGMDFARSLAKNLAALFADFGSERITKGSHLEKLCLIDDGVGRDTISDFTTNLIKHHLLKYTQTFAQKHLAASQKQAVKVPRSSFDYRTETWTAETYELPVIDGDYVILTPRDLLTKDEAWINRGDLIREYPDIVQAVPNDQLRAQLNNYFTSQLPRSAREKEPSREEYVSAVKAVIRKFPQLIDYYIKYKEDHGEAAEKTARQRVVEIEQIFIDNVLRVVDTLAERTAFYSTAGTTLEEARDRVQFLKSVIEDNDGYRIFYRGGKPLTREEHVQILFRLTWYATPSDVNREVNNGRGPVDFKISRGAKDSTLVEFKLASNKKLEANLKKQAEIYAQANKTKNVIKVIVYFTAGELKRVIAVLKRLGQKESADLVLIDARNDNKPSGSKA